MTTHGAGSVPPRTDVSSSGTPVLSRLENHIADRSAGRIHDLHVTWADGSITLHGWARTYHAKQLAQEAALDWIEILGGPRFTNRIVVA